jgi:hypothetical protein
MEVRGFEKYFKFETRLNTIINGVSFYVSIDWIQSYEYNSISYPASVYLEGFTENFIVRRLCQLLETSQCNQEQ